MGKKSKRSFHEKPSNIDHFGNPINSDAAKSPQESKSKKSSERSESLSENKEKSKQIESGKTERKRVEDDQIPLNDHFQKPISINENLSRRERSSSSRDESSDRKLKKPNHDTWEDDPDQSNTNDYHDFKQPESRANRSRQRDDKHADQRKHSGSRERTGDRKTTWPEQKSRWSDKETTFTKDKYQRYDKSNKYSRDGKYSKKTDSKLKYDEVKGNLFDAPDTFSLAHCVAEDLQMGAGIAVEFRDRFGKTGRLADQNVKIGGVAVLENKGRFIYYLVTKKLSRGKPTLTTLENSLKAMAEHVKNNEVKDIAMPMIGSGLDRLDWGDVVNIIKDVFHDIEVNIIVYKFDKEAAEAGVSSVPKHKTPRVTHSIMELGKVGQDTAFLYLACTSGTKSPEMFHLDRYYPFMKEYQNQAKKLGNVISIKSGREITFGLVCKENGKIIFSELENCLSDLRSMISAQRYEYIGIDGIYSNDMDMHHLLTLLKHQLPGYINIWVCWEDQIPLDFNIEKPNFT